MLVSSPPVSCPPDLLEGPSPEPLAPPTLAEKQPEVNHNFSSFSRVDLKADLWRLRPPGPQVQEPEPIGSADQVVPGDAKLSTQLASIYCLIFALGKQAGHGQSIAMGTQGGAFPPSLSSFQTDPDVLEPEGPPGDLGPPRPRVPRLHQSEDLWTNLSSRQPGRHLAASSRIWDSDQASAQRQTHPGHAPKSDCGVSDPGPAPPALTLHPSSSSSHFDL